MPKYEFDTARWLRNVAEIQSHRAGAGPAMLRENMLKCAEEIERLRMADDLHQQGAELMRDEMAALKRENEQLRAIISEATAAAGNGSCCSTQASVEFMAGLPKEIAMNTDALRARVAKLEEALTPSADTKAAYMGEFSFCISEFDEDGEEFARVVDVPWTTIKDIMKAIARRALEEK